MIPPDRARHSDTAPRVDSHITRAPTRESLDAPLSRGRLVACRSLTTRAFTPRENPKFKNLKLKLLPALLNRNPRMGLEKYEEKRWLIRLRRSDLEAKL